MAVQEVQVLHTGKRCGDLLAPGVEPVVQLCSTFDVHSPHQDALVMNWLDT